MKTYARIEHGTVVELFSTEEDIKALFHPAMHWVDVDYEDEPEPGDVYHDGKFSQPTQLIM